MCIYIYSIEKKNKRKIKFIPNIYSYSVKKNIKIYRYQLLLLIFQIITSKKYIQINININI